MKFRLPARPVRLSSKNPATISVQFVWGVQGGADRQRSFRISELSWQMWRRVTSCMLSGTSGLAVYLDQATYLAAKQNAHRSHVIASDKHGIAKRVYLHF
jgi:hypothetical protein